MQSALRKVTTIACATQQQPEPAPAPAPAKGVRALVSSWKNRIPDPVKRRVRVVELVHGRAATAGLMIGSVVELTTSRTFGHQYHDEFWGVVALYAALTAVAAGAVQDGVEEGDVIRELQVTRLAMATMAILFAMELAWQ